MLGKEKSKERGPSSLGPRHFTEGHHQVLQVKSEKEKLFLSRTKKAVRSLERSHHDRDYKVPFVQLLQSPQREEQSVRPSLNQDVQVSRARASAPHAYMHQDFHSYKIIKIDVACDMHAYQPCDCT